MRKGESTLHTITHTRFWGGLAAGGTGLTHPPVKESHENSSMKMVLLGGSRHTNKTVIFGCQC